MLKGHWEVDGIENAIDYVEMISHFLTKVDSDWKWKWVIIATHQALYSFGLCALAGTSASHTVTDRGNVTGRSKRQKIHQAKALEIEGTSHDQIAIELEISIDKVTEFLAEDSHILDIRSVLERLQSKTNLPWSNSQALSLQEEQSKAIKILTDEFRNEFEHYFPKKYWLIEINYVVTIITQCIPIIEFIAIDSNCIRYNPKERSRIEIAFKHITEALHQYSAKSS